MWKVLSQGKHMWNMKAPSLKVHKLWPRLKFFKCRSNFKVKVTRSKIMVWCERSCYKKYTCEIYSKSMKTQHLYFRYLSNMDLSIKILFSWDNCTLHILSKYHPLYWLIVYNYCLKVIVQKQVIWLPVMFRMSDF